MDLPSRSIDTGDFTIDRRLYQHAVQLFRFARRFLRLHIKLHDPGDHLRQGQIFVFNHFARFETLIPQYLIYEHCGAYCYAIAHRELFEIDPGLARLLRATGAVPHDHPRLLPLLATKILQGHKVVIFPEGGMVKDRRVVDRHGRYRIYSRTARRWRKQHTGAAVLALGLDLFKQIVLQAAADGDGDRLRRWCETLGLESVEVLLQRCREPTRIVPANITFFPLRVEPNWLLEVAKRLRPGLKRRHLEELLIEGNLLLRETDMDIRLAAPIPVRERWRRWERALVPPATDLETIFRWHHSPSLRQRWLARRLQRHAEAVRDRYMEAMYQAVSINLCHLAATLIQRWSEAGHAAIERPRFRRLLYLTIKHLQRQPCVHLHRSLANPENYQALPADIPPPLNQFLCTAAGAGLIEPVGGRLHFLPKLGREFGLDTILENPLAVYANEAAPVAAVHRAVARAIDEAGRAGETALARWHFDDEVRSWHWDREFYRAPCFARINQLEVPKCSGRPFLLDPPQRNGCGVLLVHGLLASPAGMRALGENLARAGYTVLGIRLKGHGTSPCDLRERSRGDWLASVQRGHRILATLCPQTAIVGFSTGALLALQLAATQPDRLMAVVAVSAPLRFRQRVLRWIPLVYQANRLIQWMSDGGLSEFVHNPSEHPETNYTQVPLRALHELHRLIEETPPAAATVRCPVLLLQGDRDPVVDPDSARQWLDRLGSQAKSLTLMPSRRHDIVFRNTLRSHDTILHFLDLYALTP